MSLSKKYYVCDEEFAKCDHPVYSHLKVCEGFHPLVSMVAFLQEVAVVFETKHLMNYHYTHRGYILLECAKFYRNVNNFTNDKRNSAHLQANINEYSVSNIITMSNNPPECLQVVLYNYNTDYLPVSLQL
jgi:hypothetical protein